MMKIETVMMWRILLLWICLSPCVTVLAGIPRFSTAGFYELPNTGRTVYSLNLAWRFMKGEVEGMPYAVDYDDSDWQVVSVPHGLEYLPVEASGGANYQGVAWYRKHFTPTDTLRGKRLYVHFEGIMGKCEVYVNGELAAKHYGGYLPVIVDVSNRFRFGQDNVIAVRADNSDDPTYPVGKEQSLLDYTYFGGIYRDCWLVAHNDVFITNANYEDEVAGGGLFVSFADVSEARATVNLKLHLRNSGSSGKRLTVAFALKDSAENTVRIVEKPLRLGKQKADYVVAKMKVDSPSLWAPEHPYLYYLDIIVKDDLGKVVDGYRQRIGIRSIEFRKTEGLWLNGKPYAGKIMGTNRHQDFAVLGNAVPNSLQWRDAKKLRDAGMKVIRPHYVVDPAFMDACDELGLFALVAVPGWQFWNDAPIFAERLYADLRNMIRIHRNHASLFFWEPILNETNYPDTYARRAAEICREEYPYPYSQCACDQGAKGEQYYDLLLRPILSKLRPDKTYFIREWGDNVDDWNAQNSDSRASRSWGEIPMLIQAWHYARPDYPSLCYDTICKLPSQVVGACFWHSFDHQRGYHADPFYGGMMDAFRQPKTAYYMFMSQREPGLAGWPVGQGPMVYIAHELTPFSPRDITIYSNCDEVRLTVFKNGKQYVYKKCPERDGMPSPVISFENAYHFMDWKAMARAHKQDEAYLLAEGIIDGKVVATHKRFPAGQPDHIRLRLDDEGIPLKADGSDVVTVIAEIVDKRGTVKRLNNSVIHFSVEGEGRLLGNEAIGVNPMPVSWGSAPALIQSTNRAGRLRVTASLLVPGQVRPLEGTLEFESVPSGQRELYAETEWRQCDENQETIRQEVRSTDLEREVARLRKELNQIKVKEVERQQTRFGVGIND